MLKKINTDFINPPAKDPTVLKIFNKHQEYEQNVKEDPSSENVALEKKILQHIQRMANTRFNVQKNRSGYKLQK